MILRDLSAMEIQNMISLKHTLREMWFYALQCSSKLDIALFFTLLYLYSMILQQRYINFIFLGLCKKYLKFWDKNLKKLIVENIF